MDMPLELKLEGEELVRALNIHIASMAQHQLQRRGGQLLINAAKEIERLRAREAQLETTVLANIKELEELCR